MPVYFITYTVLFWLPAAFFGFFIFRTLPPPLKKAFWAAAGLIALTTTAMEYVYLGFDVWSFSQKTDKLLGLWLGPAPIEEFVFWYGAPPFCLVVYFAYCRILGGKNA